MDRLEWIESIYSNLTYTDVYGNQIALVVFLTILEVILFSYFYFKQNMGYYKENWNTVRCDLNVMPFVGFINKPDDKTFYEFTEENYEYCTSQTTSKTMNDQFGPLFENQRLINSISAESTGLLADTIKKSNKSTDDLNDNVNDGTSVIYKIFMLLYIGFNLFMDTLTKLLHVQQTIAHIGLTSITWGTLFFKMMISAIMLLLIILYVFTVIPSMPFWIFIIFLIIPITFSLLLAVSSSFKNTIYAIADEFSKVEPFAVRNKPKINLCFAGNTLLKTSKGYKKIKHVRVGDVIEGSTVTTTFQTVSMPDMFNLNGIIVSGEHYVKYKKWIKVKNHPDSIPIIYNKKLYCLNTTTKTISIGKHLFLDWDDLTPARMKHVSKYYPPSRIHLYDTGFPPSFLIKVVDGYKPISMIKPGDILNEHIRVVAVVRMRKKWHIVTDKGYFQNDNCFKDYNFNIDKLFYIF